MTTIFAFPELTKNLDSWAEFVVDSPVASFIRKRFEADLLKAHPDVNSALRADLAAFMSAVYAGGLDAGRASVKMPSIFRAWTVWETVDEYGRHGSMVGVFTTKAEAKEYAKGKGWYGREGSVVEGDAVDINGTVYLLQAAVKWGDINTDLIAKREAQKAAALAKLTPEERKLLNLKDE